jgi:hypothetical protein
VPRLSAGAWRQWSRALVTFSLSSFGSREGVRSPTPRPGGAGPDTLGGRDSTTADTATTSRTRAWNDAEVALHWGAGRVAMRGVIGTRFSTSHQPNETWGHVQSVVSLAPDIALIAAAGIHPSSVAYGVTRARFVNLGFRVAPSALLHPPLPAGVRPAAAAFEVGAADGNRRTLRIRVPNARTVELSGDFTGWKPVALTRTGSDRWEATLPMTAGMHRLAIRVNGEAWAPPPGVAAVPDEFQGTVGVIVVR